MLELSRDVLLVSPLVSPVANPEEHSELVRRSTAQRPHELCRKACVANAACSFGAGATLAATEPSGTAQVVRIQAVQIC